MFGLGLQRWLNRFRLESPSRSFISLILVLLVAMGILFARKKTAFARPQFWAEEGTIFFMEARTGNLKTIFQPYCGSLYLFHRTVAFAGHYFPVRYVPLFYTYTSLITTLGILAFIMRGRTAVAYKPLIALAIVACPNVGEVYMNLTNIHWILAFGLVFISLSRDPETLGQALLEGIMLLVSCLTGQFAIMFLPLFLARVWRYRTAHSITALMIVLACCSWQFSLLQADRFPGKFNPADPNWMGVIGNGISGMIWLGMERIKEIPNNLYLALLTLTLSGCLTVHAVIRRNWDCLAVLWAGLSVILATAYGFRGGPATLSANIGTRYFFIPGVCLLMAILLTMSKWPRFMAPGAGLLILSAIVSFGMISVSPRPRNYHWSKVCAAIGGPTACSIPINPSGWAIHYVPPPPQPSPGG